MWINETKKIFEMTSTGWHERQVARGADRDKTNGQGKARDPLACEESEESDNGYGDVMESEAPLPPAPLAPMVKPPSQCLQCR